MATVTYPTLEHVAMEATPFPVDVLEGVESGLVLFAAAFGGVNDAIRFAEAGVRDVTLIDLNRRALDQMTALYRDERWSFAQADAWSFARFAAVAGSTWDVVTVDTYTGDATNRSLSRLEDWTSIANRAVVATATRAHSPRIPAGWRSRRVVRSGLAEWLVLERA